MAKKPAGLIYGVDDKPPLLATVLLGIQHVFVMTAGWVIVVVIVTTIGGTQEEVANVPDLIQPLFSSSLAISTVLVVFLNLLFRIGVTKRQVLELTPGVDGSQKIFEFMETQGSVWGARRDVIMRATAALNEFVESAAGLDLVKGNAQIEVSFQSGFGHSLRWPAHGISQ
jgi:hypothetical protein